MIYGVPAALGVWTARYGKRARADGERRAAEAAGRPGHREPTASRRSDPARSGPLPVRQTGGPVRVAHRATGFRALRT